MTSWTLLVFENVAFSHVPLVVSMLIVNNSSFLLNMSYHLPMQLSVGLLITTNLTSLSAVASTELESVSANLNHFCYNSRTRFLFGLREALENASTKPDRMLW